MGCVADKEIDGYGYNFDYLSDESFSDNSYEFPPIS